MRFEIGLQAEAEPVDPAFGDGLLNAELPGEGAAAEIVPPESGADAPGIVATDWWEDSRSRAPTEAARFDQPLARFDLSRTFAAAADPLSARSDRWTRSLFGRDAELLTPLAPGRPLLAWSLTDRLTLAGVGGSRVWDYRDRGFVVSAEAGVQLSPRAGLHFGYEVLETSTATMSPDLSGESVFARFQLKF